MRALVIVALCSTPAFADRSAAVEVGVTADMRQIGPTYNDGQSSLLGGAQLLVGFEDAPLLVPPPGMVAADLRLVPELLAGFVGDTHHVEGYAGAGLRVELQLASHRRATPIRAAMYAAVRGLLVGSIDQGGAGEIAFGEHLMLARGRRVGWEVATLVRPHADDAPGWREVDELLTIYYGWR